MSFVNMLNPAIPSQQHQDLDKIVDAIPIGVLVCDREGVITRANKELLRQFGYQDDELLGECVDKLLPPESRGAHIALRSMFMNAPETRSMGTGRELFGYRKDGSQFPLEIGLNPIQTDQGIHVIATIVDISERRRLEGNFRSVFRAAPCSMLMIDQQGYISLVNNELLELLGYELDELIGKPMEVLLPDRYRKSHVKMRDDFWKSAEKRMMGAGRDLTAKHKTGREIPVEIGLNPIVTDSGPVVVAAILDITKRKKLENHLRQAYADLDEFTYVASHDLKSPLRGITSLMEWIEEDLGLSAPDEVSNNIDRVKQRIARMEKLVNDLLSYARAGQQSDSFTTINIQDLYNDTKELIAQRDGITISLQSNVETIQSPRTPLETVLRNLINNAVKHHDQDHGRIDVEITADGSYCVFKIKDDGPGIPERARPRIFKLFQTLGADNQDSSGVGLAVVRRLVEAHGGSIQVESNTPRGSIFCFTWPRFARSDLDE